MRFSAASFQRFVEFRRPRRILSALEIEPQLGNQPVELRLGVRVKLDPADV